MSFAPDPQFYNLTVILCTQCYTLSSLRRTKGAVCLFPFMAGTCHTEFAFDIIVVYPLCHKEQNSTREIATSDV